MLILFHIVLYENLRVFGIFRIINNLLQLAICIYSPSINYKWWFEHCLVVLPVSVTKRPPKCASKRGLRGLLSWMSYDLLVLDMAFDHFPFTKVINNF